MTVSTAKGEVSDGGNDTIAEGEPYTVDVTLVGDSDMLFHRWNCEAVEAKSKAAKGSRAKKSDNIESYVYRDEIGEICLPGEYVRQSMIHAAKFKQDPRSPRKSAMDLFKAAIIPMTPVATLGTDKWDYEHQCRVTVQRAGITRVRPAMKAGWKCSMTFMVNLPEYVNPSLFHEVLSNAGRLIGVGDFRPTYGRFRIEHFYVRFG